MQQRTGPGTIERFGQIALVLAVAGALLLLVLYLLFGWLASPLSTKGHFPERDGLELVFFPLAAAMAAMVRPRLGALAALRESRVGPALPLLAAGALAALVCYLAAWWVTEREWYAPERLFGAGLVACAGVAGSVLFPRHTALLAGVIAAPALFGAAVVAFPNLLLYTVDDSWKEGHARGLMLAAAAAGAVSLVLLVIGSGLFVADGFPREEDAGSPMPASEAGLRALVVGSIWNRARSLEVSLAILGASLGFFLGVWSHLFYLGVG